MSHEELKAEFRHVSEVINFICSLYRLTSKEDALEAVDTLRLQLALKEFRSPYLERRLTGLGDINEFVEAIDSRWVVSYKI
jgi:hypothetical protein